MDIIRFITLSDLLVFSIGCRVLCGFGPATTALLEEVGLIPPRAVFVGTLGRKGKGRSYQWAA